MKHSHEEGTTSKVLIGRTAGAAPEAYMTDHERTLARLALVGGVALAIIGITDVALLWFPTHIGNAEWEFATVSATFESLPLAALGLGLITVGAILRRRKALLYLLVGVFVSLALLVLVSSGLFALDVPLALKAAPEQLKGQLKQHFLKTGVLAIAYLSLFAYMAWLNFANARARRAS